jgi:hypothetical protein
VIDDCEIPLFIKEKMYADFRRDPEEAFKQVDDALLRITNLQQGRIEGPGFHTDWSYDWATGRHSGLWYFEWTFVDHGPNIEFCILTECRLACNEIASEIFQRLNDDARQDYIRRAFSTVVAKTSKEGLKIRLNDAFRRIGLLEEIRGVAGEGWLAEVSSRRMGIDNGKDTLVHVDQILERALAQMTAKAAGQRPQTQS